MNLGSHDSFTYSLNPSSPVANDEPEWMQTVGNIPCIKKIIYNWSVTQSWTATDQLNNGVRYFDFRLSQPDDTSQPISVVHGLYGDSVSDILQEIDAFLNAHIKEVVLLDFNHYYNISPTQHQQIVNEVLSLFGSKLCPSPPTINVNTLSLTDCWNKGYQVIAFDHGNDNDLPPQIWSGNYIQSPWANTDNVKDLLTYLENALRNKEQYLPNGGFFVTQGIRTPNATDIVAHPLGTLKDAIAVPTTKDVVQWLKLRGADLRPYMNVVIADFVETDNFCNLVIALN